MSSSRAGRALVPSVVIAALVFAGAVATARPALADTTTDDGNIVVDITDGGGPSPSPTRTPGPPFPPPGRPPATPPRPGPPVQGQVTQATIPDPDAADDALVEEVQVGGVLAMSGISAVASPSFAVGNGKLLLSFVIRNTSEEAFDSTARFWVIDALGRSIAEIGDVDVDRLESDETRRVLVEIDGVGQHTVFRSYVTLTPPEEIKGVALAPITRNTTVVVAPLFSITLLSAIGTVGALAWWAFRRRGFGLGLRRLAA